MKNTLPIGLKAGRNVPPPPSIHPAVEEERAGRRYDHLDGKTAAALRWDEDAYAYLNKDTALLLRREDANITQLE